MEGEGGMEGVGGVIRKGRWKGGRDGGGGRCHKEGKMEGREEGRMEGRCS